MTYPHPLAPLYLSNYVMQQEIVLTGCLFKFHTPIQKGQLVYFETAGGWKAYWCGPNIHSQPAILAYISRGQDTSSKGLLCRHRILSQIHGNNLILKTLTVPVRWIYIA